MRIFNCLTDPKVYSSPDPGGWKKRVGFPTEFQFCFNKWVYSFFRELKKSNVGTLFRDLNINYFLYRDLEQTFENLGNTNMRNRIIDMN